MISKPRDLGDLKPGDLFTCSKDRVGNKIGQILVLCDGRYFATQKKYPMNAIGLDDGAWYCLPKRRKVLKISKRDLGNANH